MEEASFKVLGLDCAEETAILKKVVGAHPAVRDLSFDLLNARMTVSYKADEIDSGVILNLIGSTGMRGALWEKRAEEKLSFWQRRGRSCLTLFCGIFVFAGLLSHYLMHRSFLDILSGTGEAQPPLLAIVFYALSIFMGGFTVLPKAIKALLRVRPDMNLLMVIAVVGAALIHEWFEAAMVTFLFSVANLLEHWSVNRARKAISSLLDLSPTLARVIDPSTGSITERHVDQVAVGTLLLVRPGEKIPLDGVVKRGSSSINQAPITGEAIPVAKEEGDEVYAGTINEDGALEVVALKGSEDTTLARIIHLVQTSQGRRAGSEQWVERFARYYTPIMLLLSLLIATLPPLFFGESWMEWVYRGLVILVIACPCALVISTPVSIVSGLTAAARNGILIKGGMFLELAGKLKALAMDKTGTLTYGKPQVQRIVALSGYTDEQLMTIAAGLEAASEHPLARAILQKAGEMGLSGKRAEEFLVIKGKGAQATLEGKRFWIGSHRFMHEVGQETEEVHRICKELEDEGHSVVAIGNEDHICGLISIADEPRAFMKEIILSLKAEGVEQMVMLTGDNLLAAKALAHHVGVDAFYAELLPEDKVEKIEELVSEKKYVGMIGDGVNDAPAMAVSSLGIAMGAIGTDAAIETADIALMTDDLAKVPWLIRHSKRVLRIVKENILFALSLKAAFIFLALFGLASLWMAIAADTGAALLVVFNGLRSLRIRMSGIGDL